MRKDRDWSQTRAFEELREGLHFGPKSRSAYIALETGQRQPTTDEQKYLIGYFGKTPDDVPEPIRAPNPMLEVADAIRAQTEAINALVGLLEPLVSTAGERVDIRLGALEAELQSLRARPRAGGPQGPPVPDGSSG